ncbi:hypothetical protein F5148DRAFT_429608 [Russula earlei]|uniref:Uncharacterized protein n=1 Tax=Russula earlei TaxID=71964 RepID=A0ACC0TZZ3_9AGAM|nr:hypothetical protein F5148DRAFT_429608 [Russula earlei]
MPLLVVQSFQTNTPVATSSLMSFRLRLRPLRYNRVSLFLTSFVRSSLPCTPRMSTTIGDPPPSLDRISLEQMTISKLPDDVLMEIFHFYVHDRWMVTSGWHTLVHVCQTWRYIVFASPRRLNLRLEYTGKRPMSEMLDIWPALPVVIRLVASPWTYLDPCWGNIAAFLESEHRHRICEIDFPFVPTSHWERFSAAMQRPFPELTSLRICAGKNTVTLLPDSLLGASAPRLRELWLANCPFPGIQKLLLSANQLVLLSLFNIPDSGYISPQDLGGVLSLMSRLETLRLEFESPRSRSDLASRPRPPPTRSVLPALTQLMFQGVHEYLEDVLAQIEAPNLNKLEITFFMDVHFVVPHLLQLIGHTKSFKKCDRAFVCTSYGAIQLEIIRETHWPPELSLEIRCRGLDRQLSLLAQVCSSSLLLSAVVQLHIMHRDRFPHWRDDMETTQWLQVLDTFTAVKDLHLSSQIGRHVCQALEELAKERVTEVLPALENIVLRGLRRVESAPNLIEGFVSARQLSGHPVAVHL